MSEMEERADAWVQPVRSEPVWKPAQRPPLDWGDEEPDLIWERLYHRGLVDPPYRSAKDTEDNIRDFPPLDVDWPTDQMLRDMGRLPCQDCPHYDQ